MIPANPYALLVPDRPKEAITHYDLERGEDYVLLFESREDAEAYADAAAYGWKPLVRSVAATDLHFRMARYKPDDDDQIDLAL